MIKKVKSSLWLKIFLILTILLFSVSFLLYGIIAAVTPASYKSLSNSNFTEQLNTLIKELDGESLEEATNRLMPLSFMYNAIIKIEGDGGQVSIGSFNMESEYPADTPLTTEVTDIHLKEGDYRLYVTISDKLVNQVTESFKRVFPIIGCIIFMISLIAALGVSRFLTRPIIEISGISTRLTELDMTWRCDTKRTDEVGSLAANLNTMAARLDEALKGLTSANTKLKEDIERERRQEKLRVEFFRTVSHELKTPITVLKGELEGMIYQVGEYKDRDTHLRQSMRTVNEMELLVKEILSASRMAGNDFILAASSLDLSRILRESCHKWQGIAEDKAQHFSSEIKDGVTYQGDMALIQKAISNIIGNAVLHSPEHADITVTLKCGVLRVENSGVSIPAANLEQIFEPFYRADDSHSRKTGGSGLGLYIVKTILDRHGLRHYIENTSNGVCFTVFFS